MVSGIGLSHRIGNVLVSDCGRGGMQDNASNNDTLCKLPNGPNRKICNIQQQSHALSYMFFVQIAKRCRSQGGHNIPKRLFPWKLHTTFRVSNASAMEAMAPATLILQFLQDFLFPTGRWDCLKITLTLTVHYHIPISSPFFFIKMLPFWGTLRFHTTHIMQPFPHSLLLRRSWVCNSSNANFPAMEQSSFSVS